MKGGNTSGALQMGGSKQHAPASTQLAPSTHQPLTRSTSACTTRLMRYSCSHTWPGRRTTRDWSAAARAGGEVLR